MKTFLIICSLWVVTGAGAQTEQALMMQAQQYESTLDENNAFETYKKVMKLNPNNYQATWRASELCSRIGARQATNEKKKIYYGTGKKYAETAIKLDPNGADGYFALSVAMGRMALISSGQEKIKAVKGIKANAEKAIKLDPKHGYAWHVLGKWFYEVSKLNYFEKTAVKLMYGALPPASLADAIKAFEKSRQLVPDLTLNYLELARAYNDDDKKAKAIEYLKKLPSLPNKTFDDARVKAKGAALLKELTK